MTCNNDPESVQAQTFLVWCIRMCAYASCIDKQLKPRRSELGPALALYVTQCIFSAYEGVSHAIGCSVHQTPDNRDLLLQRPLSSHCYE